MVNMKKLLKALGSVAGLIFILAVASVSQSVGKDVTKAILSPSEPQNTSASGSGQKVAIIWSKNPSVNFELLRRAANEMNKQMPMMIDANTRIDRVMAFPGPKFVYYDTLVNDTAASIGAADIAAAREKVTPLLKNGICSGEYIKGGVTVVCHYSGNDGGFIMEIEITPSDCGRG
jgi:hypothetical protein